MGEGKIGLSQPPKIIPAGRNIPRKEIMRATSKQRRLDFLHDFISSLLAYRKTEAPRDQEL